MPPRIHNGTPTNSQMSTTNTIVMNGKAIVARLYQATELTVKTTAKNGKVYNVAICDWIRSIWRRRAARQTCRN